MKNNGLSKASFFGGWYKSPSLTSFIAPSAAQNTGGPPVAASTLNVSRSRLINDHGETTPCFCIDVSNYQVNQMITLFIK